MTKPPMPRRRADAVIAEHASAFELPVWRIMLMHWRPRDIARCRWAIFYALRREGYAYQDIASHFGSHHTTVMNGIERIVTNRTPITTERWHRLHQTGPHRICINSAPNAEAP